MKVETMITLDHVELKHLKAILDSCVGRYDGTEGYNNEDDKGIGKTLKKLREMVGGY